MKESVQDATTRDGSIVYVEIEQWHSEYGLQYGLLLTSYWMNMASELLRTGSVPTLWNNINTRTRQYLVQIPVCPGGPRHFSRLDRDEKDLGCATCGVVLSRPGNDRRFNAGRSM